MSNYEEVFQKIITDPRYIEGVKFGKPRRGHTEGAVKCHIEELEYNLTRLAFLLYGDEFWKLRILIHCHDAMKKFSARDVPIDQENSHASMARDFLAEFIDDHDLLQMVWFHDENFALWKQQKKHGTYDIERFLKRTVENILDIDLFLIFTIIDGYTESKMALANQEKPEKLRWFIEEVAKYRPCPRAHEALLLFGL